MPALKQLSPMCQLFARTCEHDMDKAVVSAAAAAAAAGAVL